MSDNADVASDITEHQIRVALANHKANQPTQGRIYCDDCEEAIPPLRAALVNAIRCVECQRAFEAKARLKGK